MDISEASTNEDDLTEEERNARLFATQMLREQIFVGCFKERRRVEALNEYRDVIIVNDENLKKDLDVVRKRLRDVYRNCWIGITKPDYIGAPYGHCLWVTSTCDDDYALGNYLYRIRTIKFKPNEIIVRVKRLKSLDEISTLQNTSNESVEAQISEYIQNFSWENSWNSLRRSLFEYLIWLFTNVLTVDNIKEAATFLSVLFVTTAAFAIKSVQFFFEFMLKFMREVSILVHVCTPVFQSIIDMVGKLIGGFYFLIASIYRDSRRSPTAPEIPRQRYLPIEARQRQPYTYYRPQSSVVIREIDN